MGRTPCSTRRVCYSNQTIINIGELKEFRHKDRFEKLEKEGKLDDFIKNRQEESDKKRVRR